MKFVYIILLFATSSCAIFTDKETAGAFPIYGNWCGPFHPISGTNPIVINKTDSACKSHDMCYANSGYFRKACDKNLVLELKSFSPEDKVESDVRRLIISYFKRSPKL